MLDALVKYVKSEQLFTETDRVLLAISGGMDSVCLAHLFKKSGWKFGIAHCNFKLRGEASDGDAAFVRSLAHQLGVDVFVKDFDTRFFAENQKISIQMAARELRYNWLEKIRSESNYDYIATAHHLNDSIETVLYNFTKGCGIRGLHGILPKTEQLIRPLLFARRTEIETYIDSNQLTFREDASNASDKYSRNYIRHRIIPHLKELNPGFEQTTEKTIQNIRETEWLFQYAVDQLKKDFVEIKDDKIFIQKTGMPQKAVATLLFELIRDYGFNGDQVQMILNDAPQAGTSFYSKTHRLLVDRTHYIIRKTTPPELVHQKITPTQDAVPLGKHVLTFETLEEIPDPIPQNMNTAILDLDSLSFPLLLRPRQDGDQFQPFGMQGQHKKVKDFLTNKKLNRFEKNEVHVLESDGQICWVIGLRIDERFKVKAGTKKCFKIELLPQPSTK